MKSPLRLGNGVTANSSAWDSNGSIWGNGNNSTTFVDDAANPQLRNGKRRYTFLVLFTH